MGKVALYLGISRQQAHNRKENEKWEDCLEEGNGALVPSKTIKRSRDLERQRLLQRLDKLDRLGSQHNMSDAMEATKKEYDL